MVIACIQWSVTSAREKGASALGEFGINSPSVSAAGSCCGARSHGAAAARNFGTSVVACGFGRSGGGGGLDAPSSCAVARTRESIPVSYLLASEGEYTCKFTVS